jgi:hypothetical protein
MPTTKGTIFINYRKDDSNWNALALYQELLKYFSRDQIFKDFNAISPGDDFVESINNALQACDVLLVLIGKGWLDMKDEGGARRLDDPHDFVRIEIAKALDRHIKVVPVLLDRTPMPKAADLPENLQALCRRQFVEIDPTGFEDDVRKLANAIMRVMNSSGPADVHAGAATATGQSYVQPPQFAGTQPGSVPAKPDNNLVLGILATIFCCPGLPLGILSIISANKVNKLYAEGKYPEALAAANQAKKYAMWTAIVGGCLWVIFYMIGQNEIAKNPGNYGN